MSRAVAILDMGSGKITVLLGFRGVNQTISIVGRGECEYDGFINGSLLAPNKLSMAFGKAIGIAEQMSQSRVEFLYIGVPAEFCTTLCNNAEMSLGTKRRKVEPKDIEVLQQQGNLYSNDLADTVINIQAIYYKLDDSKTLAPLGRQTAKISAKLSYTLCENAFIEIVVGALQEVGIVEYEFCSSLLAESLYLLDDNKRDQGAVLVDCGHLATAVGIVSGDGLLGQFSISVGGGHITADLLHHFFKDIDESDVGWAFEQIVELKKKIVLTLIAEDSDFYKVTVDGEIYRFSAIEVNNIVLERIKSIARTIEKTLTKIDAANGLNVYLTGGGLSYIRGVKDCLQREMGRNVTIVAPNNPQYNKPDISSAIALLDMVLNDSESNYPSIIDKIFGK